MKEICHILSQWTTNDIKYETRLPSSIVNSCSFVGVCQMRIVANPKVQKYNLFFDLLSTFIENVINICSQLFGLFCEQSKCQLSRDLGGFFW